LLADVMRVLPKRAQGITRRTVRESQRWRLLEAITEAVARRGYAEASVADVIEIAGVSRKTFYEHFRDKEDCFLKAYEVLSDRLVVAMKSAIEPKMSVATRRRAQLTTCTIRSSPEPSWSTCSAPAHAPCEPANE